MRSTVSAIFPAFSKKFEGRISWPYLDRKGLVTVGVGNLIDPLNFAFGLGWIDNNTGQSATVEKIAQDWRAVKARQDLSQIGGGSALWPPLTTIRLTDTAIDALVAGKLGEDARELLKFFPTFEDFPAEAQLGILSMAWAMGPDRFADFPKFVAAANAGDWQTAANESHMQGVGIEPRNDANKLLFHNADVVTQFELDPDRITWPAKLSEGGSNPGGGGGGSGSGGVTNASHSESFWGACILGGGFLGGLLLMRTKGWI